MPKSQLRKIRHTCLLTTINYSVSMFFLLIVGFSSLLSIIMCLWWCMRLHMYAYGYLHMLWMFIYTCFYNLPFIHIRLRISFSIFEEHLFIDWFNWGIVALQCCLSFLCPAAWRSHRYTYLPFLWSTSPSSCSGSPQSVELSFLCYTGTSHSQAILYMVMYICQFAPSSLSPTVPAISIFFKVILLHGCVIDYFTSVLLQLGT